MIDEEGPYIIKHEVRAVRNYNPKYGDDRVCECGHPYYRHFDPYEDNAAVGCKYCECADFREKGGDHVLELRLCEAANIILRANRLYRFTVDPDCPKCVELDSVYPPEMR